MKTSVKKIISLIMASAFVLLAFASCGDTVTGLNEGNEAKYKIGICQFIEHAALDSALEGFKAALTQKLGEDVYFDYKNATGEKTNAASICSSFASSDYDLIFANSTNALAAAAEATSVIPIVATSVTDFGATLGIENLGTKTGFNVTGASDLVPLEKQADIITELFPDAKNVGILYCSSEVNSKYQAERISSYLTSKGYTCKDFTFVDTTDVTLVTQQAATECDVIFTPTDNTVASNTQAINNILEPAGVPVVTGDNDTCIGLGVATLGINYYTLGYEAGLMAYEILAEGKDPADMEIRYADDYIKKYIPDRCTLLDIEIPDGYTELEK